ncbi:MBL fold metallo-hydrolase [Ktedonosporobacter rubrisoli]|uniref:MBL fold metallo-hydrolase n=1 Tax=Ktedonosporobacter rubrisoli TaxID=2509675 RepID=A0A4P6JZR9_KTERU|nr:MBL fold metallo-hydrolase [Ktedonosporobacter rubrisoli]QBD81269.1 MBL fold metallo-hydrolase [Ktedonosporobacter rubrisoli]
MRVVSLGSGSSGNALLVEAGPQGRTKLLVDAGLSARMIMERLRRLGVYPSQLQGVLVTHEHRDHVLALPMLAKHYAVPIITDARTYKAIEESVISGIWRTDSGTLVPMRRAARATRSLSSVPEQPEASALESLEVSEAPGPAAQEPASSQPENPFTNWLPLPVGSHRLFGDIEVTSFPISHDAIAPCGYLLAAVGGCNVCIVTDSGEVTPKMLAAMQQADLLIVEANHDRERLLRGPYPYYLKQRILSAKGHLSNEQAADAILRTWRSDVVRWLWLSHLSRTNNTPALALKSVSAQLRATGADIERVHLAALPPGMGDIWDSAQLWYTPSLWD